MQLVRSENDIEELIKKVKANCKEKGNRSRASVLIANAQTAADYLVGECTISNMKLWNYHFYEELNKNLS